jgi:hypothetical protein
MKIIIKFTDYQVKAELLETPTGRAIYKALPLQNQANTWGDEIYFGIPVDSELEPDARSEVAEGDLAYWPSMPAFCIFFGPTPASRGRTPVTASPVNVFGRLSETDVEALRKIRDGETLRIEKADQ